MKRRKTRANATLLALFAIAGFYALAGCGLTPGVGVANEVVPPSATYLTSGNFTGSTEVSGTAQVFIQASTVLLHLDGLVAPIGAQYTVFLEDGNPSTPFFFTALKASFGNQNYFTGRTSGASHFTRVVLRAGSATNAAVIASAVLAVY